MIRKPRISALRADNKIHDLNRQIEEEDLPNNGSDEETVSKKASKRRPTSPTPAASSRRRRKEESARYFPAVSPPTLSTYQKKKRSKDSTSGGGSSAGGVLKARMQSNSLSQFNNRPNDSSVTNELILQNVEIWQENCLSSLQQFSLEVKAILEQNYPTETRTLLDQVLALFVLFHPEHMQIVIQPIIDMLTNRVLTYSRKRPPFYSFLNLFARRDSQTESDQRFQHELLGFLASQNLAKTSSSGRTTMWLSGWISDCLVEGGHELQIYYFHTIISKGFSSKQTNVSDQIISVIEQQVYKHTKFQLASIALPMILEYDPRISVYGTILKIYFSNVSVSQSQKIVHQIIFSSPTQQTSQPVVDIFIDNLLELLPSSDWFHQYFFSLLLQGLADDNIAIHQLLIKIFSDSKYHSILFGDDLSVQLNKKSLEQFASAFNLMDYATQSKLIALWEDSWAQSDVPSVFQNRLQALVSIFPFIASEFRDSLHSLFLQLLSTFMTHIFFLPISKSLLHNLVHALFSGQHYFPLLRHLISYFLKSKRQTFIAELQYYLSLEISLLSFSSNSEISGFSNSYQTVVTLLSLITDVDEPLIAPFFHDLFVHYPASLDKVFQFLRSNHAETRAAILQIFASLPLLSSSYLWSNHSNLLLLLASLLDPFPTVSKPAKICLRRIGSEKRTADLLLPLFLNRLFSFPSSMQASSLVLIEEISFLLTSRPDFASQILSSIETYLFFSSEEINADFPVMDGSTESHITFNGGSGAPALNPHVLALLNHLISTNICAPPTELIQYALDFPGSSSSPSTQIIQFKLAETCLEHPSFFNLVSLPFLVEGLFSPSNTLRELSSTILLKLVTQEQQNQVNDPMQEEEPKESTAKRKTHLFSIKEIKEQIIFRSKFNFISDTHSQPSPSFVFASQFLETLRSSKY